MAKFPLSIAEQVRKVQKGQRVIKAIDQEKKKEEE